MSDTPATYVLRIQGELDGHWATWFDGMTLAVEPNGTTTLTGLLVDQAALHGMLRRVRDLGLTLLAVERQASTGDASPMREEPPAKAERGEQ